MATDWTTRSSPPAAVAMAAAESTKGLCESSYPHKVDIQVPDEGLGRRG